MNTAAAPVASVASAEPAPDAVVEPVPDAQRWAVDWALVGALSGVFAPLPMHVFGGVNHAELVTYQLHAATVGSLTGLAVGLGLAAALGRAPARTRAALGLVSSVAVGSWGALVAGLPSFAVQGGDFVPLAFPCGGIAGMLQGVWLVPLYVLAERYALPRWPLVLGAGVGAPVLGAVGIAGVLVVVGLVT